MSRTTFFARTGNSPGEFMKLDFYFFKITLFGDILTMISDYFEMLLNPLRINAYVQVYEQIQVEFIQKALTSRLGYTPSASQILSIPIVHTLVFIMPYLLIAISTLIIFIGLFVFNKQLFQLLWYKLKVSL